MISPIRQVFTPVGLWECYDTLLIITPGDNNSSRGRYMKNIGRGGTASCEFMATAFVFEENLGAQRRGFVFSVDLFIVRLY